MKNLIIIPTAALALGSVGAFAEEPNPRTSAQSAGVSPPPNTRLEQFQAKTGSVVIKGYTEVGSAAGKYGSTVSVTPMEFTDATSDAKQFGIAIEVKGSGQYAQKNQSYIDLDEVDSLLSGIDYIGHADKDVTKLADFEATYRTKGDFSITVFSRGRTGKMVAVESGRFRRDMAYFDIADLQKLRQLIQKAQITLQSLK